MARNAIRNAPASELLKICWFLKDIITHDELCDLVYIELSELEGDNRADYIESLSLQLSEFIAFNEAQLAKGSEDGINGKPIEELYKKHVNSSFLGPYRRGRSKANNPYTMSKEELDLLVQLLIAQFNKYGLKKFQAKDIPTSLEKLTISKIENLIENSNSEDHKYYVALIWYYFLNNEARYNLRDRLGSKLKKQDKSVEVDIKGASDIIDLESTLLSRSEKIVSRYKANNKEGNSTSITYATINKLTADAKVLGITSLNVYINEVLLNNTTE
ncbi:hypothetical protein L1D14_10455 [Vibrio tubiashii]|uniref:hypothetical protein n=1 Tax=Vibrio tubiashii TaxID=29498 RepID=UPI001EFD7F39|nr:hypothetical protein [Vibrio tubiashii]MCG9576658.1 hypothetical protein [Vibrio tubiashii]